MRRVDRLHVLARSVGGVLHVAALLTTVLAGVGGIEWGQMSRYPF